MATKTKTKTKKEEDQSSLDKIIYSFTVEKKETVKETEEQTQEGKDGKKETVSITKEVEKLIPYQCIIRSPSRREMEEAELEYSIEMSKCIKRGILTKAMLAKKYFSHCYRCARTTCRRSADSWESHNSFHAREVSPYSRTSREPWRRWPSSSSPSRVGSSSRCHSSS